MYDRCFKHHLTQQVVPCTCTLTSMMHWQVVATGWNHKVLVWQDEEAETVSEYRMFSGHRCANHRVQSSRYRSLWLQFHTSLIPVLCPKQITQAIPPMFAALTRQSHRQLISSLLYEDSHSQLGSTLYVVAWNARVQKALRQLNVWCRMSLCWNSAATS